jgi:hypothetical protein
MALGIVSEFLKPEILGTIYFLRWTLMEPFVPGLPFLF